VSDFKNPLLRRYLRVCLVAFALVLVASAAGRARESGPGEKRAAVPATRSHWAEASLGTIDRHVFNLALGAAHCAVRSGAIPSPSTLTVIDYSKPSTEKRLWVFDMQSHELLYEELVAHGQGSGGNFANVFSNEPDTHASSLGLFATEDTYVGKNGYSLRLKGLDEGFNHRARERAIVMHGAPYVSDDFVKAHGRLGRSWGCPALREGVARKVIDRVRGSGLLFAYYPNQDWLTSSRYLTDCDAADGSLVPRS
jgi:hypothetical protein